MSTKSDLLKIIRAKCVDCCCDQPAEVKLCPSTDCSLWPFRMATDPYKKVMSEAQRATRMEALQKAWEAKKATQT